MFIAIFVLTFCHTYIQNLHDLQVIVHDCECMMYLLQVELIISVGIALIPF